MYTNQKIYGCPAYVYINKKDPQQQWGDKFITRAQKGQLVSYKGLYIYRVYLPYKNRVIRLSSVTFNKLGTFFTTPISKEEGGDGDICQVLLKELPTNDTILEVSQLPQEETEAARSLQEGTEAAWLPQEADEVSRALQLGDDSQSGGASGDHDIAPQPN